MLILKCHCTGCFTQFSDCLSAALQVVYTPQPRYSTHRYGKCIRQVGPEARWRRFQATATCKVFIMGWHRHTCLEPGNTWTQHYRSPTAPPRPPVQRSNDIPVYRRLRLGSTLTCRSRGKTDRYACSTRNRVQSLGYGYSGEP